jgi:hypothetical protein
MSTRHGTSRARRAAAIGIVACLLVAAAGAAAAASPTHRRPARAALGIAGRPAGRLAPGTGIPIDLRLTNRRRFPLRVMRVTVSIRAKTSRPACDARRNFGVRPLMLRHALTLPPGRSRTLAQLGYSRGRWPRIVMRDTRRDQATCAGARVALRYTATARRAR